MKLFFNRKPPEESEEADLEPKPKSKRVRAKASPKPWGKRERCLIFILLSSTAFASAFLALYARAWHLPGFPQLSLPSFDFQKTYVFEKDDPSPDRSQELTQSFRSLTNSLSGVYAFSVIRLSSSFSYGVNQTKSLTAASLIKLPVIAALYLEFEQGNLDLDDRYLLTEADKLPGAGSLYYQPAGTAITYRELARLMANQSDNTAFAIARRLLGDSQIDSVIRQIGMTDTSLAKNKTTSADIALFFQKLYLNQIVSETSRDQILISLTDTAFEDFLPAALPTGIKTAHKFGREVHVLNDAGIIFTPEPFVLVFLSDGIIDSEAEALFPQFTRSIYDFEAGSP